MYMNDIKLFANNEIELEINANNKNIQSRYMNGIWCRKMCHADNEMQKMTEGRELPNQEKIRTLWEKEAYKYLGILEADTIKQVLSPLPWWCLLPIY